MFIHLNVKSCFTLMNSIVKIDGLLDKTKRTRSSAVAITDVNTMHTFYNFEKMCIEKKKKEGYEIYPIFGITFLIQSEYIEKEYFNLTLIAQNSKGYSNLINLSTIANTNHQQFSYLTYEELEKHCDGLFCLTGAEEGEIFYCEINNHHELAISILKKLKGIYGTNLYLEVSNHFIPEEIEFLESGIIEDALKLNIEPVATNNVYYLQREHAQFRSLAVSMNSEIKDLKRGEVDWLHLYASRYVDYNDEFYLKTENEMSKAFSKYLKLYPMLFDNTVKIANSCNAKVPITDMIPEFPLSKGYTEESFFRELMLKGFEERFPDDSYLDSRFTRQDYIDRMNYEFETVKKMGFLGYLLIVQDFIMFAKDSKVYLHPEVYFPRNHFPDYSKISKKLLEKNFSILVGKGRGSGAGSLLCYILQICDIEPLKYDLLFERFLNIERVSMPDIDTDFMNKYRYLIVEYVQNKYGFTHVSQIATFQELGVKSILKNVGKAIGLPYILTDELSKNVPKTVRKMVPVEDGEDGEMEEKDVEVKSLEDIKNLSYFKDKITNNEDVAKLFKNAKLFDGLPSSTGRHACGIIIGAQPLQNFVALMEVDGVLVSQFEKKAAESIGLLKMDFLGLITLDIEAETLRLIKEVHGIDVDLNHIPLDDKLTYELLQKGMSGKVFQLESSGMRKLLKQMHPTNIGHLNSILALYR